MAFNDLIRMGASASGDYEIERSLRFNSDDSPKLSRSFSGSDANLKTQTYSFWFKRKKIGSQGYFITAWNGSNTDRIGLLSDNQFHVEFKDGGSTEAEWHSKAVWRDETAWYHAVVAIDTTQAVETNRLKVWINGVSITEWHTYNAVDQDYTLDGFGNNSKTHVIGAYASGTTSTNSHFDGYIAEFHYLDGVVKTASDFGKTDPVTGAWIPIKYTGTYGTRGWYLNFSDNSGTGDSELGADSSGNGNNWSLTNLSVSAGINNDSFIDTPTNNFMNMMSDGRLNCTVSEGGMKMVTTGSNVNCWSTFQIPTTGKWYFEYKMTTSSSTMLILDNRPITNNSTYQGAGDHSVIAYLYAGTYEIVYNGSSVTSGTFGGDSAGTVHQFWVDRDANTLKIGRDDDAFSFTWNIPTALQAYPLSIGRSHGTTWGAGTWEWYFGANGFLYDQGTTWKKLCTANLPEPTIKRGKPYFDIKTYTGTGSSHAITGLEFQPNLVYAWRRNNSGQEGLFIDSIRGGSKSLGSNSTAAENSNANRNMTFQSNGVTWTSDSGHVNASGGTYVNWYWKEDPTAGFDIVSYTGNASGPRTISHNLGVKPELIIFKNRDQTTNWMTYNHSVGAEKFLYVNTYAAQMDDAAAWNDTEPTSSVFTVNADQMNNGDGDDIIAYLFASVPGYSKISSFTGNGDNDGPMVWCGFKPRFVITKKMSGIGHWYIWDTERQPHNEPERKVLWMNYNSEDEGDHEAYNVNFYASGFKVSNDETDTNDSGSTHLYLAFADVPFKYASAR